MMQPDAGLFCVRLDFHPAGDGDDYDDADQVSHCALGIEALSAESATWVRGPE
jgi:hypothetical protein